MDAEGNGASETTTSNFVQELQAIPVISGTLNFYNKVKNSNKLIRISLNYAEQSINGALSTVTGTATGYAVDRYLGEKMAYLKHRFPVLQKTPKKVVKKVKVKSKRRMEKGASLLLKSFIGQFLISCLDASVKVFEKTLGHFYGSASVHRSEREKETSEKHVQTEMMSPKHGIQNGEETQEFYLKSKEQKRQKRKPPTIESSVMNIILFPLVIMVDSLKIMQKYLYGLSGKTTKHRRSVRLSQKPPLTPEKKAEIDLRRKVSPRKRLPSTSSVFTKLRNAASKLFGLQTLSSVRQTDIRQFITCSKHQNLNESPVNAEDQKKRKHDEVLSDEDSDTDEDILSMNLEDYISDEDPDYNVSEEDGDSSDATITSEEEKMVDYEEITDISKEAEQMMKGNVQRERRPKTQKEYGLKPSTDSTKVEENKTKSEESQLKVRFETDKALAFTQNAETSKSPKNVKDVGKGQKGMDDKDVTKKTSQTKPDEAVKIQLRPHGSTASQFSAPSSGNQKPENPQRPPSSTAIPGGNPKPENSQQTWTQKK